MKQFAVPFFVFCLGWMPFSASAQIDIRLTSAQEQFLPAESLEVAVKISNFTGEPLRLGTHSRWIDFTVERTDGGVVNKLSEPADIGDFSLQQATSGTIRFDLAPLFALQQPGSYRITATVTPIAGGNTFASAPLTVEIVNGVRLNEDRTFGYARPDGTIAGRKFILQQVNYLKHLRLYLRVTDGGESQTLKVLQLGPMVSFNRPQWVMDRQSHLHVLHQTGPDDLRYHEINPEGLILARQVWRISGKRPELRVNESGEIAVVGGMRRPDRNDIPAPVTAPAGATSTEPDKPSVKAPEVEAKPTAKKNASPTAKGR
jgi:hypothetical protein